MNQQYRMWTEEAIHQDQGKDFYSMGGSTLRYNIDEILRTSQDKQNLRSGRSEVIEEKLKEANRSLQAYREKSKELEAKQTLIKKQQQGLNEKSKKFDEQMGIFTQNSKQLQEYSSEMQKNLEIISKKQKRVGGVVSQSLELFKTNGCLNDKPLQQLDKPFQQQDKPLQQNDNVNQLGMKQQGIQNENNAIFYSSPKYTNNPINYYTINPLQGSDEMKTIDNTQPLSTKSNSQQSFQFLPNGQQFITLKKRKLQNKGTPTAQCAPYQINSNVKSGVEELNIIQANTIKEQSDKIEKLELQLKESSEKNYYLKSQLEILEENIVTKCTEIMILRERLEVQQRDRDRLNNENDSLKDQLKQQQLHIETITSQFYRHNSNLLTSSPEMVKKNAVITSSTHKLMRNTTHSFSLFQEQQLIFKIARDDINKSVDRQSCRSLHTLSSQRSKSKNNLDSTRADISILEKQSYMTQVVNETKVFGDSTNKPTVSQLKLSGVSSNNNSYAPNLENIYCTIIGRDQKENSVEKQQSTFKNRCSSLTIPTGSENKENNKQIGANQFQQQPMIQIPKPTNNSSSNQSLHQSVQKNRHPLPSSQIQQLSTQQSQLQQQQQQQQQQPQQQLIQNYQPNIINQQILIKPPQQTFVFKHPHHPQKIIEMSPNPRQNSTLLNICRPAGNLPQKVLSTK